MRLPFVLAVLGAATLAAPASATVPRVAFTSDIDAPAEVPQACPHADSESWPMLGADPIDRRRLRGVGQISGVQASVGIASDDGGRTWDRTLLAATACAGGPADRAMSVNPQVAVGPGAVTWFGQSWVNGSPFAFSVDVLRAATAGAWTAAASPNGDAAGQNIAIVPDPDDPLRATAVWTDIDQPPLVPGYAPAGSRLRAATTADGGATWSAPVTALEPGLERYALNARAVRTADGGVLAIADTVRKDALLTGDVDDIEVLSSRSADGAAWEPTVAVGRMSWVTVADPDHDGLTAQRTNAISFKPDLAVGEDGTLAVSGPLAAEDGRSTIFLATSSNAGRSWTATRRTVDVPSQLIQPAVAIDDHGRIGLQWYDFRHDEPGDATWDLQPRVAVQDADGTWRETALSAPFDLHATNECTQAGPVADPFTAHCELTVDAMAIGVYPDLVGLDDGFGAGYTVGSPLAGDGFTDARFSRVVVDEG